MKNPRASLLRDGVGQLGLKLEPAQFDQLLQYLDYMHEWNQRINLTAIKDPREQVIKHLLDSLAVAPYLQSSPLLDVGTGAGLPGVPLAIVFAQQKFVLLDSNIKRISFIRFVSTRLKQANLKLESSRVEHFLPSQPYSQIISRAFASLQQMVDNAEHLLAPDGRMLAMKGRYPEQEIASLPPGWALHESHRLQVPFLDDERHLLVLKRTTA